MAPIPLFLTGKSQSVHGITNSPTLCKEKIEHMPCRSQSKCNGLGKLTYEFWGDTIQPMQRIVKKGDWGLYQSPPFRLLLRGGFTPSTSNVAPLRAEQFPGLQGSRAAPLMKARGAEGQRGSGFGEAAPHRGWERREAGSPLLRSVAI